MKILVPVKRVLDHTTKVQLRSDGLGPDLAHRKMVLNPFDEVALEEALRLREAGAAQEVVVVSCGEQSVQETLRHCLALGADRAVLVDTSEALQPLGVAKLLKALALREQPSLILCGKQAIDDDAGQTGPMLAALLGWPQATAVVQLALSGKDVTVTRALEGGQERLSLSLPALVSAELHLNMPRFASLVSVMKARRQTIEIIPSEDLAADTAARLETLAFTEPAPRPAGRQLRSAAELVACLREAELVAPSQSQVTASEGGSV